MTPEAQELLQKNTRWTVSPGVALNLDEFAETPNWPHEDRMAFMVAEMADVMEDLQAEREGLKQRIRQYEWELSELRYMTNKLDIPYPDDYDPDAVPGEYTPKNYFPVGANGTYFPHKVQPDDTVAWLLERAKAYA